MCDASKEMQEVVNQLLKKLNSEQSNYADRANRMFSVRELTVPLLYVIPLMASIFVGALTLNSYINELTNDFTSAVKDIKNELTQLKNDLTDTKTEARVRSYDRVTRTDLVQICYNWQLKNPAITLECNAIYNIQHLNQIIGTEKK